MHSTCVDTLPHCRTYRNCIFADRYYLEIQYTTYRDILAFRFPVGHIHCNISSIRRVSCRFWIMPTFMTIVNIEMSGWDKIYDCTREINSFKVLTDIITSCAGFIKIYYWLDVQRDASITLNLITIEIRKLR